MDNELKDILYYLDWNDERRFLVTAAARKETGTWELLVKRTPEPLESDLGDICYQLQLNAEKVWHVLRAQRNEDGSWNLEIKRKERPEAAHDNNK